VPPGQSLVAAWRAQFDHAILSAGQAELPRIDPTGCEIPLLFHGAHAKFAAKRSEGGPQPFTENTVQREKTISG
jgi:hypothetical protein